MKVEEIVLRKVKQIRNVIGKVYNVDFLFDNLHSLCVLNKRKRFPLFIKSAVDFYQSIHKGKSFTDEELKSHPYFTYLAGCYKKGTNVERRCLYIMRKKIALYQDVKANGMRVPIDLVIKKKMYIYIYDGINRLIIYKILGRKYIVAKVFKNKELYNKFPKETGKPDNSIHGLAVKQLMTLGYRATDKYWASRYTPYYDLLLSPLRKKARKVIEFGVQRGASLLLWRDAFPNAHIYGVDRDIAKAHLAKNRKGITLIQGQQEDANFIRDKIASLGNFDIVIDDAGHRYIQQKTTFDILWDKVNAGGWYVIEDLYTSYYGGDFNKDGNMMWELKGFIDKMTLGLDVASMHFYYGICFIEKR